MMRRWILLARATATAAGLVAATPGHGESFEDEPPPPVRSGESLEPDIRIIRGEDKVIIEYRVNGQVRAVKVEPDNAPAYFLVDYDGDGNFEVDHNFEPAFVTQWMIFSW